MLPYRTLQEAEIALGRALSYAETLWFNYSARKSDAFLYAHNLIFLICLHSLVPLPLALLELKRGKSIEKYKLQPKVKMSYQSMLKCYMGAMKVYIFAGPPLILATYFSTKWVGIRTSLALPSLWEVVAQLVVYFVVEDFGHYWNHRFMHIKWVYEKIHKVHHEVTAPIGFASPYAHWAEISVLGLISFLGPAMVPCHMVTFWVWIILRQLEAIETHSGYEFPWSPTKFIPLYGGAAFHDFHHFVGQQSQSNFASIFTYLDYVYGTDKGYRYQKQKLEKTKE